MKEVLTNEEIDTLLELFRQEGPPIEEANSVALGFEKRPKGEGPVVSEVDLLKPNRFTRDQIRSLERVFDGTAKTLAATISDKLRLDMQCACVAVEQMRFQAWMPLVGDASAIYVLRMAPFEMPIPLTVSRRLLYGAVDRILGGSGRVQSVRDDFTAAEYTVADAFVGPCLDRICESLTDVVDLSWSVEGRYCNTSMAEVVPSQDVILSVHFQVSGEFLLGDVRLPLPYNALAPFLEGIEFGPGSMFQVPPGSLRTATQDAVMPVPVGLSVVLGNSHVPLRQLLDLEIGDVVPLATRIGQPLVAPVQGVPKFMGQVGTHGCRLAFQVGSVVEKIG